MHGSLAGSQLGSTHSRLALLKQAVDVRVYLDKGLLLLVGFDLPNESGVRQGHP